MKEKLDEMSKDEFFCQWAARIDFLKKCPRKKCPICGSMVPTNEDGNRLVSHYPHPYNDSSVYLKPPKSCKGKWVSV